MKRVVFAIAVGASVVVFAAPAHADDVPLDGLTRADAAKLSVVEVDKGRYLVVGRIGGERHMFYGSAKVLHRVRLSGGSSSPKTVSYSFWAPGWAYPLLYDRNGAWSIKCADKSKTLKVISGAAAAKITGKAEFRRPLWNRTAAFMARDNRGIYYYVDRLRDTFRERPVGFRLFIGRKGALKEIKLVDAIVDTEGAIFVGRRVRVNFDRDRQHDRRGRRAFQVFTGKAKDPSKDTKLKWINPELNAELIYRKLGVYDGTTYGTPCEDLL